MDPYATRLAEGFAARVLQYYFQTTVTPVITNREFEGEIKDRLTKLNIGTLGGVTLKNFTGSDMTADDPTESIAVLSTDQAKSWYFKIHSLAELESFIKNPQGSLLDDLKGQLREAIDAYTLGLWSDAASGNWVGTSYTTGTVEITVTTGAVVGAGTTFTSAMVGKPFKAAGHTSWYRVKTYTDATHIVIEDDSDDLTSAYTGGAIGAGATYEIQANSAVQITKSNIYEYIFKLKTALDKRKVPLDNRWIVMPADLFNLLPQAPEVIQPIGNVYEEVVNRGYMGMVGGFKAYSNEQIAGDAVNGYKVMAGRTSGITFATAMTETEVEPFLKGNFGKAYKGLEVYGAKVPDIRRKDLAMGLWKI